MKKLACFCISVCFALVALIAVPVVTAHADSTDYYVVYVYDEQGWALNAYCYSNGSDFGSGWPGVELESEPRLGDDWYSFTLPADPTGKSVNMILFNRDNDQVDRVDVSYNKDKPYCHTYGTASFATKAEAETNAAASRPKLVSTIYVYNFSTEDNAERWDNIYARCYNNQTGEALGEGTALTAAAGMGAHWYKYDLSEQSKNAVAADYKLRVRVVVSDGEAGKEKLTIVSPVQAKPYYNTYCEYGFDKAETAQDDKMNCVYSDPKTGTTRLYYYNTQRWKAVYAYSYWTYVEANNKSVEDFGSWPGKAMREVSGHENWYYIDLPQDPANLPTGVNGVGVVFNGNTKGRIKKDAYISDSSKTYVTYEGDMLSSFAACEAVSEMIPPLPPIEDFMLDTDAIDTTEKVENVTTIVKPSLTAPIIVLSIAGGICLAIGIFFLVYLIIIPYIVRRKQK